MYRSWIPKPNKPGQMRAITQPNKTDIIVMDALSHLLNIIFEDLFLSQSHGFRKGRGPITFFIKIRSWNRVDKLMKSDIVKSFDNIDHGLLISILQSHLGEENASFCDLISAFLKTQILDKKGNDYSNYMKGIPQGSSLSPVLMNIFMHQLDMNLHYFMQTEESLGYARYADDMIFAINNEFGRSISEIQELFSKSPKRPQTFGNIHRTGPKSTSKDQSLRLGCLNQFEGDPRD